MNFVHACRKHARDEAVKMAENLARYKRISTRYARFLLLSFFLNFVSSFTDRQIDAFMSYFSVKDVPVNLKYSSQPNPCVSHSRSVYKMLVISVVFEIRLF